MPLEFHFDESVSEKQLNHQSTSLVIPQLTRARIHNSMYYKVNLHPAALRGINMLQLIKKIVKQFGTTRGGSHLVSVVCGGVEFKCLLMKLVHLRPTWSQVLLILQRGNEKTSKFDNKYLVILVLVYLRVQYYYLPKPAARENKTCILDVEKQGDVTSDKLQNLFRIYINDYRKVKSMDLDIDCWSNLTGKKVDVLHIDEIVDWLCTQDHIWGIPLGKSQWIDIFREESSDESTDESSDESTDESDDNNDSNGGSEDGASS